VNYSNIEILSHPSQNGYCQEDKQQMLKMMQEKMIPYTLLLAM
jgi:hypothetical protein